MGDIRPVGGHWKNRLVRGEAANAVDFWEMLYDAETGFDMVKKLAYGYSDGHHGDFLLKRIEALTIRGTGKNGWIPANIFGYVLEGTCRSVSNLLERFHQSFLYYILPRSDRYMSNGDYFIPLGMLLAIPLIFAVKLWFEDITIDPSDPIQHTSEELKSNHTSDEKDWLNLVCCYLAISYAISHVVLHDWHATYLACIFPDIYLELSKKTEILPSLNGFNIKKFKSFTCFFITVGFLCFSLINFSVVFIILLFLSPMIIGIFAFPKTFSKLLFLYCFSLQFLGRRNLLTFKVHYFRLNHDYLTFNLIIYFLIPVLL